MELSMSLPLDGDGFLMRSCPACLRDFMWLPSDHSEVPPDGRYSCPYCGGRSESDEFWTETQLDLARQTVLDALDDSLKSSGLQFERSRQSSRLAPTDDRAMSRVDFLCHPGEPVKVLAAWVAAGQPVRCLICGAAA